MRYSKNRMGTMGQDALRHKKIPEDIHFGSSASLLSQDMGRVLTGRHITFGAMPFSFREYLRKRGWEDFAPEYLAFNKDKLLHYLGAYLEAGGFPETIGLDDFGRKQVLTSFTTIFLPGHFFKIRRILRSLIKYAGSCLRIRARLTQATA